MQKKRPDVTSIMSIVLLIIGIVSMIVVTIICIQIKCPTAAQCFLLYTLVGIGIPGILLKSAGQTSLVFRSLKFSIRIVGCIAVPFLLYVINPIDSIKGTDCEPPVNIIVQEPPPQDTLKVITKQPKSETPVKAHPIPRPITKSQPVELIRKTTVQCNGLTKIGNQCKRPTHSLNGYCNLHQPKSITVH